MIRKDFCAPFDSEQKTLYCPSVSLSLYCTLTVGIRSVCGTVYRSPCSLSHLSLCLFLCPFHLASILISLSHSFCLLFLTLCLSYFSLSSLPLCLTLCLSLISPRIRSLTERAAVLFALKVSKSLSNFLLRPPLPVNHVMNCGKCHGSDNDINTMLHCNDIISTGCFLYKGHSSVDLFCLHKKAKKKRPSSYLSIFIPVYILIYVYIFIT